MGLSHPYLSLDAQRDIHVVQGPLDILDHAAPVCGAGSKMGIDATRKIPGEGQIRQWPDEMIITTDIKSRIARRWTEFGL